MWQWSNVTLSRSDSWITTRMTVLQSFLPEICSLICQDSTLERLIWIPLWLYCCHRPSFQTTSQASHAMMNIVHLCKLERISDTIWRLSSASTWITGAWVFAVVYVYRFKLTKFVNGYFSQENSLRFALYLRSQTNLESLELHSGRASIFKS